MATPKQEKLITLLIENYGKGKNTKTLGKLLIEAGYSKESAHNPQLIMEADVIQNALQDFIETMEKKRRSALNHMTEEKFRKAPAKELAYVTDILTKNVQLLTGKDTEKVAHQHVVEIPTRE